MKSSIFALLLIASAAVAAPKPPLPVVEFGTAVLENKSPKSFDKVVNEKKTLGSIRKYDGKKGLKYQEKAAGSYRVIVAGKGDDKAGEIEVEIVFRGFVAGTPIEIRGTGWDKWPHRGFLADEYESIKNLDDSIKTKAYVPKDKNGRRIFASVRQQWVYDETHDSNGRPDHDTKNPYHGDAKTGYKLALHDARVEVEKLLIKQLQKMPVAAESELAPDIAGNPFGPK